MACWVYSSYHPRKPLGESPHADAMATETEAVQCPVKPPEPAPKPKRTRRTKAEMAEQS